MFETVNPQTNLLTDIKSAFSRLKRKSREKLCAVMHGGHELYRAHTDTRIYQECVNCGMKTEGWTIERRDRNPHMVRSHYA